MLAFDFMPEQIDLAKRRGLDAEFFVGDVTNIDLPSEHVDVVFIFAILLHVPEWRLTLVEVARVLKPRGIFLVEEVEGPLAQLSDKYFGTDTLDLILSPLSGQEKESYILYCLLRGDFYGENKENIFC
ncbi:class I SAM-dependent methyltransferase [Laceyella putida]|uniref:Class I SAM-dependent methyltransferase n=1 Tax=Laceyella putida TaxID=110101 RepID=A0ABW2RLF8_9BACL